MKKRSWLLALLLILASPLVSACSISTTSTAPEEKDSSVFLSLDGGNAWRAVDYIPTVSGRPESIANLNVNRLEMDPQDNLAIYLASFDEGLFYTYKVTDGWQKVASLPRATVNDVKIDPKNKCIIYAAIANRLYRSGDCARNWSEVYVDNLPGVSVNAVVVDHYNPANVYIGTSRGEIVKSIDAGAHWRTIQRLDEGVSRLMTSPLDSRLVFVATEKNRIYSFRSNTMTNPANSADLEGNFLVSDWLDLNDILREYNLGQSFKGLVVSPKDGLMFLATEKLILRSSDSGVSWEQLNLIPSEEAAVINALAVNPQDSNHIYYVTNTTFYSSTDGGATWATKKLPTKRAGRSLLIDFKDPSVVYLGTVKLK